MEHTIKLTSTDIAILNSYKLLCAGLADYLGDGYEFVLHSLDDFDHSVIEIINGHHTGREVGAPITDLALSMLSQIKHKENKGYISYLNKNKNNAPLKSATIAIKGENDRIIGLLCINFYMNTPLSNLLAQFIPKENNGSQQVTYSENFLNNHEDLFEHVIMEIKHNVLLDNTISANNKNKEIITRLHAKGMFNFKDSVIRCANLLGISKNTVYLHLRNLEEDNIS